MVGTLLFPLLTVFSRAHLFDGSGRIFVCLYFWNVCDFIENLSEFRKISQVMRGNLLEKIYNVVDVEIDNCHVR